MKRIRLAVQLIFTILTNGYVYGYLNGKIYQGALKYACVPGLNCYSCPGAIASCPLGALQALLNQRGFRIPFGMLGFSFWWAVSWDVSSADGFVPLDWRRTCCTKFPSCARERRCHCTAF